VREQFAAISAMAPGTSVAFGVQVVPCTGLKSLLVPKGDVVATVDGVEFFHTLLPGTERWRETTEAAQANRRNPTSRTWAPSTASGPPPRSGEELTVADLAYTRSGEKGELINIAVIARQPEDLSTLRAALTPDALKNWFADLGPFEARVFDVPGIHALNIVLDGALPGGLNASQRLDPAAKSVGQRLLSFKVA
jgi:hypothetical protein